MQERQLRRIQLTGGSTYIVSLPKDWVKAIGLKVGDYVITKPQPDGSLKIIPAKSFARKLMRVSMVITPQMSKNTIAREFISRYLAGYDIIEIKFKNMFHEARMVLKDVLRKMIGVEIIEEYSDRVIVQCLANPSELPVKVAVRRMANLALYMLSDFIKAIKNENYQLLKEMEERDDTVDKFYKFILRQLKMVALGLISLSDVELNDLRECLGYRLVIKSIERIADHVVKASNCMLQIDQPIERKLKEQIIKFGNEVSNIFQKSIKALFNLDVNLAHIITDSVEDISKEESEIVSNVITTCSSIKCAMFLRLVIESLKRIADYSADIAEIAINLAIENPLVAQKKTS